MLLFVKCNVFYVTRYRREYHTYDFFVIVDIVIMCCIVITRTIRFRFYEQSQYSQFLFSTSNKFITELNPHDLLADLKYKVQLRKPVLTLT